jgi:hypothetical protein
LLAVAIASLSASAFAMAPVISDFRSPIISDDTPATNSNDFVYPDAINLDNQASDPDQTVTPGNIIWSFLESTNTYRINNRQSMNLGGGDNPNAPGTKGVGVTGQDDAEAGTTGFDTNVRTITFRNNALSPWAGPGAPPTGTFPTDPTPHQGFLPAQTKLITMFASDGSTYTQKSFFAYTYNGGLDSLSGVSMITVTSTVTPVSGTGNWTTSLLVGTPTFTATSGLCVTVPLGTSTDANFGGWASPYGILPLVKNNVYRVRLDVAGNPAIAPTVTPLWDFVIDNVNSGDASHSEQKYGMDLINWDNTNSSSNSAGVASPAGRHTFDIWWSPMAIQATDWNDPTTGEFSTSHSLAKDGRFLFRILDVAGPVDAQNDAGTLCLKDYQISRIDISDLKSAATLYDNQAPVARTTAATATGANMWATNLIAGSTTVTNGGGVTLTPTTPGVGSTPPAPPTVAGSWNVEILAIRPDDGTATMSPGTPSTLTDNYVIPWVSDQLLKITMGAKAPDAASQTNYPDVMRITMDAPTSELGLDTTFSGGGSVLGMPKSASVTTYTTFCYTQNKTGSATPEFQRLRPQIGCILSAAILSGGSNVNNGGVTFTFLKVERIDTTGL